VNQETDALDSKLGPVGRAIVSTAIRKALTVAGVAGSATLTDHTYVAIAAVVAAGSVVWSFWKEIQAARLLPK
jgi:hypothetical protein